VKSEKKAMHLIIKILKLKVAHKMCTAFGGGDRFCLKMVENIFILWVWCIIGVSVVYFLKEIIIEIWCGIFCQRKRLV
jgi:hypothetical protein